MDWKCKIGCHCYHAVTTTTERIELKSHGKFNSEYYLINCTQEECCRCGKPNMRRWVPISEPYD
jgi:hypothetical protein